MEERKRLRKHRNFVVDQMIDIDRSIRDIGKKWADHKISTEKLHEAIEHKFILLHKRKNYINTLIVY